MREIYALHSGKSELRNEEGEFEIGNWLAGFELGGDCGGDEEAPEIADAGASRG